MSSGNAVRGIFRNRFKISPANRSGDERARTRRSGPNGGPQRVSGRIVSRMTSRTRDITNTWMTKTSQGNCQERA